MLRNKMKFLIGLILIILYCCASVFSQEFLFEESRKSCECPQISNIEDVKLDLDFNQTNIRDILNHISYKTGVTFVVDQSLEDLSTDISVKNVSWKKALDEILISNYLAAIIECPTLRIARIDKIKEYNGCDFSLEELDGQSLYTEFINMSKSRFDAYNTITQGSNVKVVEDEKGNISFVVEGLSKFQKLLSKMLPKNSSLRTDRKGKFLIITESKDRLRLFNEFIEVLKKLPKKRTCANGIFIQIEKFQEENRIVTEIIETQNIFSDKLDEKDSNSQKNWVKNQEELAKIIFEHLDIDIKLVSSGLEITTTKRKMDFVKNVIALFDKQILEEE